MRRYQPPLTLAPYILALAAEIGECVRHLSTPHERVLTLRLRRDSRVRAIQAPLVTESNTLSVEQVTAVLNGRRVLGSPHGIREVRNAFSAYKVMLEWQPSLHSSLLVIHALLMHGLIDDAGSYRHEGVGIYREECLLHTAPSASQVPQSINDLLAWLSCYKLHPLTVGCVFHHELESAHPPVNVSGWVRRLWQTLILSQWRAILAYLPVENVTHEQQDAHYGALAVSSGAAEVASFVEFMLAALCQTLLEGVSNDQVGDQVSGRVARLLQALPPGEALKASELMQRLGLAHHPILSNNYLKPALTAGLIEIVDSASPRNSARRYRRAGFSGQALKDSCGVQVSLIGA